MALPAFAAKRRATAPFAAERRRPPLSTDISCPPGAQQQTRRTPQRLSNDGTDRRTDGRTWDRYVEPAAHTVRAVAMIVLSSDSRGGGVAVISACVSIIVGRENSDKHGRNNTIQSPSSCLV